MNSDNIKDVLEDYITKDNFQYALLINGDWGSGKTFLWKNKLSPVAMAKGYKVIYISLNGIRKIEALEHLMFIRMLPYLNQDEKGKKSNFAAVLGNIANAISKHYLKNSLTDLLKGASVDMFDYKNTLVCFDDLERCQIPIKEVLGYINDFVEHKNLKTVILADESHISKQPNEQLSYANIKEKVIGRILNFSLEPDEILPQLFSRYIGNADFSIFIRIKENSITGKIKELRLKNLRMISFYLDTLQKLYPLFKNEEDLVIEEILYFTASICIEFKNGNLESKDYNDYKGLDDLTPYYYSRALANPDHNDNQKDKVTEASFAQCYYQNYVDGRFESYHFYPAVYHYVLSGYLDRLAFTNELVLRNRDIIPEHRRCFSSLINYQFRNLEDNEFSELTVKVKDYALEGVYSIYDYAPIADFYFFFSDKGLVDLNNEQVRDFVLAGIGKAKQRKEIDKRIFENLMHFKKDNPETEKIKLIIAAIHKDIVDETEHNLVVQLLDVISSTDKTTLLEIFEQYRFSKTFLSHMDMGRFAQILLSAPNILIPILEEIFTSRYNSMNIGEFLAEDIVPLKQLELEVDTLLKKGSIAQPKKFLLKSFIVILKESWLKLENTEESKSI